MQQHKVFLLSSTSYISPLFSLIFRPWMHIPHSSRTILYHPDTALFINAHNTVIVTDDTLPTQLIFIHECTYVHHHHRYCWQCYINQPSSAKLHPTVVITFFSFIFLDLCIHEHTTRTTTIVVTDDALPTWLSFIQYISICSSIIDNALLTWIN